MSRAAAVGAGAQGRPDEQLLLQAQLLDAVEQAVIATDTGGAVIYWNRAAEAIFGWSAAEALGRPITELTVPELGQAQAEAIMGRLRAGEVWSGEYLARRRDGSSFPVIVTDSPIYDGAGALIGMIGISTDISAQKRAEAALQAEVAERRRAQQALATHARHQGVVAELARRSLIAGDLDGFLREAAGLVAQTLGVERCAILERLPGGRALLVREGHGWPAGVVGRRTVSARSRSLAGAMLASRQALAVDDLRALRGLAVPALFREQQAASALGALIHDGDGPFGLLCVCDSRARGFGADERHFLQTAADILAAPIARDRLESSRQGLLLELEAAQEEERQRIAREIHDELGQYLAALLLHAQALAEGEALPPAAREHLRQVQQIADRLSQEAHHLALQLRPTALDDQGLQASLANYVEDWARRSGIPVDFQCSGLTRVRLPAPVETTLYRVAQEALTNILRHAGARAVSLVLDHRGGEVALVIEDDGRGFDPAAALRDDAPGRRLGLRGMRERVALLGGTLSLEAAPGAGTSLFVRIPLSRRRKGGAHAPAADPAGG